MVFIQIGNYIINLAMMTDIEIDDDEVVISMQTLDQGSESVITLQGDERERFLRMLDKLNAQSVISLYKA